MSPRCAGGGFVFPPVEFFLLLGEAGHFLRHKTASGEEGLPLGREYLSITLEGVEGLIDRLKADFLGGEVGGAFGGGSHWYCGWCISDNGEGGKNVEKYFYFYYETAA